VSGGDAAASAFVQRNNRPALCVWSFPMADFVPALSLYVLTAAVSIVMALSWVA
jgi:hypothetical protein